MPRVSKRGAVKKGNQYAKGKGKRQLERAEQEVAASALAAIRGRELGAEAPRQRDSKKRARDADAAAVPAASSAEPRADPLALVKAAYASIDGYAVAREEKAEQRASGVFRDGITYGEVDPAAFAQCLEWVEPVPGEAFYDLGSGTGKAVLTAAALHPFASATGIEIQPALHAAALAARRAFEQQRGAALRAERMNFECGDAFAHPWPEQASPPPCSPEHTDAGHTSASA